MSYETRQFIKTPDYTSIRDNFARELKNAAQGEPSSLSFIKHPLAIKPLLTQGIAQGIVIGGTNYIASTELIQKGGSNTILKRKSGILPTFSSRDILVAFLKEHMDPRANAIGINFGFPLSPTVSAQGSLDGKLINGTKEHTFSGLEEPIGELAESLFTDLYKKTIPISVANDTICLALAGNKKMDGSIIAGTGFNMALRTTIADRPMLVNLEAGNFTGFPHSETMKQINAHSEEPGKYLFEKSLSGKYLFKYFNILIDEFGLTTPHITTSQELSAIATSNTNQDVMSLSRQIITHSARLVASALAGVHLFLDRPDTVEILGEGSLFWNGWEYQKLIKEELKIFGIAEDAIRIHHVAESSIKGAIGLITNF